MWHVVRSHRVAATSPQRGAGCETRTLWPHQVQPRHQGDWHPARCIDPDAWFRTGVRLGVARHVIGHIHMPRGAIQMTPCLLTMEPPQSGRNGYRTQPSPDWTDAERGTGKALEGARGLQADG